MPHCAHPLVPALFAASLAAAAVLGITGAASAADECIEKPDLQNSQAGHWYYRVDRVHNRRCWYFEASEAATNPPSSRDRTAVQTTDSQSSWFSRFTAGLTQSFSSEPQQTGTPDDSGTVAKPTPPKHSGTSKTVRRERPRLAQPSETNGAASAERHDRLLPQPGAERDEKRPTQLTPTDRDALFEEFLKWNVERNVFGRP